MTTTYTEELPFDLTCYRSKIDGALVIEVDTSWDDGDENHGIRINLNDGVIYEGDPNHDASAVAILDRIRGNDPIRAAALTEEQWQQTTEYRDAAATDWWDAPRPVLVMWGDPTETPSQCIARLNTEVVDSHRRDYVHANTTLGRAIIYAAAQNCDGTGEGGQGIADWREHEYVRGQVELITDVVRLLTPAEYDQGSVEGEELKDRALTLMREVNL